MKLCLLKKHFFSGLCLLVALLVSIPISAQGNMQVKGVVTDKKTGEALIGVSVAIKGTTNGTVTDVEGRYTLNGVSKGSLLIFSYVSYDPVEIQANSTKIDVALSESTKLLDEVVVIGYGSVKRKDVTTAISSVSTKDLDQRPIVSAGQAIQGKAAGVSVIQPSGTPGGEMSIRVRGTTSFNGNNDPLYVVDGVAVDNLKFLSPNDIADIQILKDASSAAIYGSRAANGVVIITTKAGQKGDAKISFNAQLSLNKVSEKIKPLNHAQYKELQDEIGQVSLPDGLKDETNWFEEAYSTGHMQNYQVSVSDGNEKMRYYLSGGYVDEKGTLNTAFFKRYNFRANIDSKVRKWLNVSANLTYSDYTENGISASTGANRGGVVLSVINTPTYAPIWDAEHPNQYYNNFYGIRNITNPLENMRRSEFNKNRENRLLASGSAVITFMPELNLKSTFTLDRRNGLETRFLDPISTAWGRNQYGEGADLRNMNTLLVFDNVLTYTKKMGKHGVEAMAGTSWTDSDYTNSWIYGSHYNGDVIQTLNAANKIAWNNTGSAGSQWGMMSYFGRVAYNFDSKYLLTANVRQDGSSKLHPDHRWSTFPSVSAAWRISSENFMSGLGWLDDMKLRAGWGQTGNQSGIGDYGYLAMYDISRQPWFEVGKENALPTLNQKTQRTLDLGWERTNQVNVGVDFTALKNRLTVNIDYYYKKTTDMLTDISFEGSGASVVGGKMKRNDGEMTNKGFEVFVNSRNMEGDFSWNTDFNISFNKNNLSKLKFTQVYYSAKTTDQVNEPVVRNAAGHSLGGFFGYISDGVDPETGELMYRDMNNDGKITSTDRTYIGDPNPDFIYGLTNSFSWKNINLSIFIQGSYGNDIYNASRMELEGMYDAKNQSTKVLDRWRVPGQIKDVPKARFDMKNSTYFVEDGSYLRVKDISVSYNITCNYLKKMGISRLQPYFTASNLLTWTKYSGMDPEVNMKVNGGYSGAVQGIDWGIYPHSKSFVFGVNVEF